MSRRMIWLYMLAGGVAYQAVKPTLGLPMNLSTVTDQAFWTASAFLVHWAVRVVGGEEP